MAPTANGCAQGNNSDAATIVGAANDSDVTSFWSRYEHAKYGDVMKNVLIEDVITRYENLQREHKEYVQAHHVEREYTKTFLEREEYLQGSLARMQRIMNRDPYILVLIDGDGMIFNNAYLNQGEAGGKQGASILHNAITDWAIEKVVEYPTDSKVVVRIYANLRGLADTCTRAGIVDHPAKVWEFARGFTSGKTLFDFTDVGAGKDRADGKISETFKIYVYNYHCRQIVFGCSHDNGYARLLEQYMSDEEALSRVTLLEGTPFEKELAILPFQKAKFPGIFRDNKISIQGQTDLLTGQPPARVDSGRSLNANSVAFTPRTGTPASVYSPYSTAATLGGQPMSVRNPHVRNESIASSANDSDTGGSWATVTKKNAHQPFTGVLRTTTNSQDAVSRNRKGQRLDTNLEYNREEVQRIKKMKACNQHYLGTNGCCHYNAKKEDKCPHDHRINFSATDKKWLRVVARETPCKKGHECDDPKCIYGHHCPFPVATEGSMRGVGCLNGNDCRFPSSMHGMDLAPFKTTRVTGWL
ncbi:hypothetical protein LTR37_015582 [Vermiconidia calcicola]|uniref:Uncharacterized protein n=1 Tax=Vermiconidia calcicola TaxID=1690605 RepID=A0ACC3MRR7_9PEZI|nr:hypothetical protein LTR37_015582 [Vermiconidia calcicola]